MPRGRAQLAIDFRSVVKQFGDRRAVDGLTLSVARGEVFGLLGPNGSGKTTTVNMLTGLSKLTEGSVHVLGYNVATQANRIRAQVGAVPQETALYEELTAHHNLRLHAQLYFVPKREQNARINAVLELVKLADRADSRVRTFSGGMKRRLALARSLLHDPELIVLDEPTLGVDVQSRQALWDYILRLKAIGKTVLITTNYLEEADALCDRLAILDHGRVVALDSPEALRSKFGTTHLVVKVSATPGPHLLAYLQTIAGVADIRVEAQEMVITIAGDENAGGHCLTAIAQTRRIVTIEYRLPSLDSVFLGLTGRELRD